MRKSMQESNGNAKIRKNAQNANSDFKYKRILQLYKSRAGKPRNFLQLSDNDVEFCRNVVQETARFVLVSLCVV